jgi:hypothetical protein
VRAMYCSVVRVRSIVIVVLVEGFCSRLGCLGAFVALRYLCTACG